MPIPRFDPNAFMMAFALAVARQRGRFTRDSIDIEVTRRPQYYYDGPLDVGAVGIFRPNVRNLDEITLTLRSPEGMDSFMTALREEYDQIIQGYAKDNVQ